MGLDARPHTEVDSAITLLQAANVQRLPGFAQGVVTVQDAAAQLAAPLLECRPGMRILDACAAPGGKTAHILETIGGAGEVIAVDKESLAPHANAANSRKIGLAGQINSRRCHSGPTMVGWRDVQPHPVGCAPVPPPA